jgi:hypothetical protein
MMFLQFFKIKFHYIQKHGSCIHFEENLLVDEVSLSEIL